MVFRQLILKCLLDEHEMNKHECTHLDSESYFRRHDHFSLSLPLFLLILYQMSKTRCCYASFLISVSSSFYSHLKLIFPLIELTARISSLCLWRVCFPDKYISQLWTLLIPCLKGISPMQTTKNSFALFPPLIVSMKKSFHILPLNKIVVFFKLSRCSE